MTAKEIIIVRDRDGLWDDIVLLFGGVNAAVVVVDAGGAAGALRGSSPDLVVLGEEAYDAVAAAARGFMQLVISLSIPPGHLARGPGGRKALKIGWPVEEEKFLTLTSRLLNVPERRLHRTTVRVTRGGGGGEFLGESADYSLSGMAFRSPGALEPPEEVTVHFGDTGIESGMRLPLEVVRAAPGSGGGGTLYGGRFIGLSLPQQHSLERFVWSIREV